MLVILLLRSRCSLSGSRLMLVVLRRLPPLIRLWSRLVPEPLLRFVAIDMVSWLLFRASVGESSFRLPMPKSHPPYWWTQCGSEMPHDSVKILYSRVCTSCAPGRSDGCS